MVAAAAAAAAAVGDTSELMVTLGGGPVLRFATPPVIFCDSKETVFRGPNVGKSLGGYAKLGTRQCMGGAEGQAGVGRGGMGMADN